MRSSRIAPVLVGLVLAFPFVLAACSSSSSDDAEPFNTLQACYDEHHGMESLPVQQAIVVCCLDHPIAGVHPSCGNSQAECVAHVDQELDPSVTASDIDAACMDYIDQK